MRAGKKLAHDDFAAVAKDLIARGVTAPPRLACKGGSNGGLLVGNMLTRYPDLFGAIDCAVPLLDTSAPQWARLPKRSQPDPSNGRYDIVIDTSSVASDTIDYEETSA